MELYWSVPIPKVGIGFICFECFKYDDALVIYPDECIETFSSASFVNEKIAQETVYDHTYLGNNREAVKQMFGEAVYSWPILTLLKNNYTAGRIRVVRQLFITSSLTAGVWNVFPTEFYESLQNEPFGLLEEHAALHFSYTSSMIEIYFLTCVRILSINLYSYVKALYIYCLTRTNTLHSGSVAADSNRIA